MDPVVVDGANIAMQQRRGRHGDLGFLFAVLERLQRGELDPVVIVDASLRHRLRPTDQEALEAALWDGWQQVPKGTDADAVIIQEATRLACDIVTNDRFRDHDLRGWTGRFVRVGADADLIRP